MGFQEWNILPKGSCLARSFLIMHSAVCALGEIEPSRSEVAFFHPPLQIVQIGLGQLRLPRIMNRLFSVILRQQNRVLGKNRFLLVGS